VFPSLLLGPLSPATTTLPLHDALPIWTPLPPRFCDRYRSALVRLAYPPRVIVTTTGSSGMRSSAVRSPSAATSWVRRSLPNLSRSEEHTSELQSRFDLVCRLLLEKKK